MNYKYILSTALATLLLFSQCTTVPKTSTLDRSQAPKAGAERPVEIAKSQSFTLDNGLKVFVVEDRKIPQISYSLVTDYDPVREGKKVGLLDFYGSMLRRGTQDMSKAEIDESVDFIGGNLITYSRGIFASSLTKHSDKLLSLVSDIINNPTFPEEELEKVRKEALSNLQTLPSSPDAIASNVVSKVNYGNNHPYGEIETEETLKSIEREDLVGFHKTYFRPNTSYLAIVGDITLEEAKTQAQKFFGEWESGVVLQTKFDKPSAPQKPQVAISNRPGAVQSVVRVTYPIYYPLNSDDYVAARLMNGILGNSGFGARLLQNLREDKAYTYGAYSSLSPDELMSSFVASASVRNEVTDSAVVQFLYELERMANEQVTQAELERIKSNVIGSFVRSLESPQTIANFAINKARYNLPDDFYDNYISKINSTTIEDIQAAAKKYIKPNNVTIVAVGDQKILVDKLAKFGNVQIYDAFGEPVTEADESLLEGVTAEKVINNYLEKVGGEAWNDVKTMTKEQQMSIGGMQMNQNLVVQNGEKLALDISSPMGAMRQVFDGQKGFMIMGPNKREIPAQQVNSMKEQTLINPAAIYDAENGYKMELVGVQSLDGQTVYEIKITNPKTGERTQYFDPNTGLLVKEVSAQGETMMSNYKKIEGTELMIPYTMEGTSPQGAYKIEVKDIKINPELDAKVFVVE